jgi:hypothetical protein
VRFLVDAQFDALLPDIERALLAGEKRIEVAPRDRTPFQLILRHAYPVVSGNPKG